MSSPTESIRNFGRASITAVCIVAITAVAACGDDQPSPDAQPAPDVSTFEDGGFDDIPRYPKSKPVGPRSSKDGVDSQSFKATGATPRDIIDFYRQGLGDSWTMDGAVEDLGVGTLRADWVDGDRRLRISATQEDALDQNPTADRVVVQYSLNLRTSSDR